MDNCLSEKRKIKRTEKEIKPLNPTYRNEIKNCEFTGFVSTKLNSP